MAFIPPAMEEAFEKGGQDVLMQAAPSQAAAERSMLETNRADAIMAKTAYENAIIKAQLGGSRGEVPSRLRFSEAKARLEAKRRSLDLFYGVDTTYDHKSTEAIRRANREYIRNFDFHAFHQSQAKKNDQPNNMKLKTKAKDTTIIKAQQVLEARLRFSRFSQAKARLEAKRRSLDLFLGVDTTYDHNSKEAIRRANREYLRNFDFHAYRQSQAKKNDQLNNMKLKTKAKDTTIIKGQQTSLLIGHSYCACAAGIEAAEAATDLMRSNIALKETTDDKPAPPVADDLVLGPKRVTEEALKKRKKEEMKKCMKAMRELGL